MKLVRKESLKKIQNKTHFMNVSTLFERGVTFYLYFMLKDRSRSIHKIKAYHTS